MPLSFDTIGHYAYNKFDYMNKFLNHIYINPETEFYYIHLYRQGYVFDMKEE